MDKYTRKDFDSVGDMLHFAENIRGTFIGDAREWAGGKTLSQTIDYIRRGGDPSDAAKAQALVNKIDATFRDRSKDEWTPAPYGAYPIVADYLAGDPFSMRTKVRTVSDIAPIKLVIEHNASCKISQSKLNNRAAAVAALAQRLSEMRPVELWLSMNSAIAHNRSESLYMVRLDASPVNVGQLVAMFGPAGLRMLGIAMVHNLCDSSRYDSMPIKINGIRAGLTGYIEAARRRMELQPQDVYVAVALRNSEITDNPEAWVNKQLEAQREIIE